MYFALCYYVQSFKEKKHALTGYFLCLHWWNMVCLTTTRLNTNQKGILSQFFRVIPSPLPSSLVWFFLMQPCCFLLPALNAEITFVLVAKIFDIHRKGMQDPNHTRITEFQPYPNVTHLL